MPAGPTPPPIQVTANAYILAGGSSLGPFAFGDEPVTTYRGERLRWINADTETHALLADTAGVPDFLETGPLPPGGERSFTMARVGTTTFHCSIHPAMVGTLVVRDR
jgi:plastocyanin